MRGRCGKLLPGQLNEIKMLSSDLKEEITAITEAVDKFLAIARIQGISGMNSGQSLPSMSYTEMLNTPEYKTVVVLARSLSDTIRQWRNQTSNASAVMAEELPHCRAALIHSKQYRIEVKKLRETFKYCGKALQFWRFLVLKVPEVRQAEEAEERQNRLSGMDQDVEQVGLNQAVSKMSALLMSSQSNNTSWEKGV